MNGGLSRKEAAESLGIGAAALLYYERRGMIRPARLEANGYRLYSKEDLARLSLILKAKDLGLTLKEISGLFAGIEGGAAVEELREGAAAKAAEIRRRIRELEARARSLEELAASPSLGECEKLRAVARAAASRPGGGSADSA